MHVKCKNAGPSEIFFKLQKFINFKDEWYYGTWMDKHDIADLDLDIWLRAIGG